MRFLELYEQFLLEHNVVNRNDIAAYVGQFASDCKNPHAAEWFNVTLARHLEKDDQSNVRLDDTNIPRNAPDWLDAAMARGDDLRVFQAPIHLNTSFEHLVDYFNFLDRSGDPVMANRDRILKVDLETALKKSQDWTNAAAKKAAKTAVEGVEEVFRDGTFCWVEPQTFEAYKRDGAILGHCTAQGTYDAEFKSKAMRFYFLHDDKGQPHVCVSVNRSGSLDQVKGKQNKAPIGRYAQLCANFLNKLHLPQPETNHDVQKMGLKMGPHGLTRASQMGEMVFKVGKVRVYKVVGEKIEITNRGFGMGTTTVGGGDDYWFNSSDGDLFKINVGSNGFAYLNGFACSSDQARALAKEFLNGYFKQGAPAPMEAPTGLSQNDLVAAFGLSYDYISKSYGTLQEVSEKKLEIDGGYTGYVQHRKPRHSPNPKPFLIMFGPDSETTPVLEVELGSNEIGAPEYTYLDKFDRDLLIKVYNALDLPPSSSYRNNYNKWRRDNHIFYNLDSRTWGGIEVCPVLWSKGGYTLRHRKEIPASEAFMMVKKGDEDAFYEFERGEYDTFWRIDTDGTHIGIDVKLDNDSVITKTLLAVLNKCQELQWLRDSSAGKLDEFNVFFANGKWQSRESAGEVIHRFDDGAYVTSIPRPNDEVTYSFYDGSEELLCAVDIALGSDHRRSWQAAMGHLEFSEDKIRASRYLVWLFNHFKVNDKDTVDGDRGYNGETSTKGFLWRMGMFYDTRSESWKLVQDGKLVHDGEGYRAVNFRNRIFIIDNHDGCVGWFKKGDSSTPANVVTDEHVFAPHKLADLYHYLSDLCANTDFEMPQKGNRHSNKDDRRRHGYAFGPDGTFNAIEKHYPSEVVLKLPKGYQWVRRAHDSTFYNLEDEKTLHHDRYSLCDKEGKSFMRVEIEGDYLNDVVFSAKDTFDTSGLTSDLSRMQDGPQKKILFALLEKLDKQITPTQATDLKYYRTKTGAFKPLASNKMLEGFLKGWIDFDDGHVFKRDSHYERDKTGTMFKWELGIMDETAEHAYDKWKPYIRIILDDEGIDSVSYLKKSVKRKPNEYMPYIQKLMKIFAMISGD
jgi:hypothetical protein